MGIAIAGLADFLPGDAPHPVELGNGLWLGRGRVVPEINFTLPPCEITTECWPDIRRRYATMTEAVLRRFWELEQEEVLVELETLPETTLRPGWGLELTQVVAEQIERFRDRGMHIALRLTPNDIREFARPPLLRGGRYWIAMLEIFEGARGAGADLVAVESTGGKEVFDDFLINADIEGILLALGVLAPRDVSFLWGTIVGVCGNNGLVPSGDSACGFANTAMVLAERKMIPRVLAAVIRVASVARSAVAIEQGAVGPSKDCAYEGPYLKAIYGIPISMEGRTAACAHLSPVGNVAQAVCDCWSNESVQDVQLLSGRAPVVSAEQLTYDCRFLNTVRAHSVEGLRLVRDCLAASDAGRDPQAWVLDPAVVLRLGAKIAQETNPFRRTVLGAREAVQELGRANQQGDLRLPDQERAWLERIEQALEEIPDDEEVLLERIQRRGDVPGFLPEEYGLFLGATRSVT